MGAWWKIAKLELTLAFRDRESLMWSLVAPIAMAWIFGSMFDSKPPQPTRVAIDAGANPVYVRDGFAELFTREGFVVGDDGIHVEFPDSLMEKLASGDSVNVKVLQGDASDNRARAVSARVREGLYRAVFQAGTVTHASPDNAKLDLSERGPLWLTTQTLGVAPRVPDGRERTLLAMLIMFVMFQVMTFFLQLWVEDLRTGKIKRIAMSPTRTTDLLVGQLVARLVWAVLQVVVILGAGSLVMGIRLNLNWVHMAVVLGSFMLTAAALGMFAGSFFKTSEKATAVGVMISLTMAALGGCWWPLEIVPPAMRAVARVLPTGQAMDAFSNMLALGPSAPFPLVNVLVLLGMAALLLPLAARRMRAQLIN